MFHLLSSLVYISHPASQPTQCIYVGGQAVRATTPPAVVSSWFLEIRD